MLLNNGCSTYKKPSVYIPDAWPKQYSIQNKQSPYLPSLLWWKQFNSPELEEFITKAVQNNYQTNLAIANIEATQSQLQQIKLSWLPNLSALAGFSQFPNIGNPGTTIIFGSLWIPGSCKLH